MVRQGKKMKTARRRRKHNELFSHNTARNCDDGFSISPFLANDKEDFMNSRSRAEYKQNELDMLALDFLITKIYNGNQKVR